MYVFSLENNYLDIKSKFCFLELFWASMLQIKKKRNILLLKVD